ncbi:MAG: Ig-like domain repeat protein [Nocardioides sp.]|nr:Ig-like domain repeat protein [Nocardioides sp.]
MHRFTHAITRTLGASVVAGLVISGLVVGLSAPAPAAPATGGRGVLDPLPDTLVALTAPVIGGTGAVGAPLSLTTMPTWNVAESLVTTSVQWFNGTGAITGATGSDYVPTAADAGGVVLAVVTGTVLGLLPVPVSSNAIPIPLGGGAGDPGDPGTDLLTLVSGLGLPATAEVGQLIALTDPVWSLPGVTTTYQWLRDGAPIPGADDQYYVPGLEDAGHAISAKVTGTLVGIPGVTVLTEALAIPLVSSPQVSPASDVAIKGTPKIGTQLTLTGPTWDPSDAASRYQWLRDESPIAGATTARYTLTPLDLGHAVSVKETGHKDGYTDNTITSDPVIAVIGDAIQFTTKPRANGIGKVGKLLTADPGSWSGAGEDGVPPSYAYQWRRDGVAIVGAVAQTYQVQPTDAGRDVTVTVTATRPAYKPGTFTTSPIAVAKRAAVLRATLAKKTIAKSQRGVLALVLKVAGVTSPTGRVKVLDGRKVVSKLKFVSGKKGKATVRLPRLKPGVHKLKAVYAGTATISGARSKVVKLTVKK